MTEYNEQQIIVDAVAENLAQAFLDGYLGFNMFIGGDIEQVLANKTNIIYRDIDDPAVFGAAITYKNKHFVMLNTHQMLRVRYYTAARELWHLATFQSIFGSDNQAVIDLAQNRDLDLTGASDHFAKTLMLPKAAVKRAWSQYVDNEQAPSLELVQNAIIRIADLAAMPYDIVVSRLDELGLLFDKKLLKWTFIEWQACRATSAFVRTPLDEAIPFNKFPRLSNIVTFMQAQKSLGAIEAAELLANADPEKARAFFEQNDENSTD